MKKKPAKPAKKPTTRKNAKRRAPAPDVNQAAKGMMDAIAERTGESRRTR